MFTKVERKIKVKFEIIKVVYSELVINKMCLQNSRK